MRGKFLRIGPRRHALDEDVGQFGVEAVRHHRGHLRERGVLHDGDRTIFRLALVTVDDVAHRRLVHADHLGQHLNRPVQVLGLFADDGNAVGLTVLDQHLHVAIEDDAARRAQRQRPLVIVLGHLLELRVLHDLQHPEADGQHREHHDHDVLQDRQPDGDLAAIFNSHSSLPCGTSPTGAAACARHDGAQRRPAGTPPTETPARR